MNKGKVIFLTIFIVFVSCNNSFGNFGIVDLRNDVPQIFPTGKVQGFIPPVLISPVGGGLPATQGNKTKFTWQKITGATVYELWIVDSKGQYIIRTLAQVSAPAAGFTCTAHSCSTNNEIELKSSEGKWSVLARTNEQNAATNSLDTDIATTSGWSPRAIFGKKESLQDKYDRCIKEKDSPIEAGDLPFIRNSWSDFTRGEWTVGLAIMAQAIKYDFAKKKQALIVG